MEGELDNKESSLGLGTHFSWRRTTLAIATVMLIAGNLCILGFAGAWLYYQDRFLPGINVAGVSVGGKTTIEAYDDMIAKLGNITDQIATIEIAGQTFHPKLRELGVEANWEQTLQFAYTDQSTGGFLNKTKMMANALTGTKEYEYSPSNNVSPDKIAQFVDNASIEAQRAIDDSTNNFTTVTYSKDEYILNNQNGSQDNSGLTTIDKDKLSDYIRSELVLALNNQNYTNIKIAFGDITGSGPNIDVSDLTLSNAGVESAVAVPIVLKYGESKTTKLSKNLVTSWLKSNGLSAPIISRNKISAYVKKLALKVNVRVKDRLISDKTNKVYRKGANGRMLKQSKLVNNIVAAIKANSKIPTPTATITPTESPIPTNTPNPTRTPTATPADDPSPTLSLSPDSPMTTATTMRVIQVQFTTVKYRTLKNRSPYTPGLFEGKYIEINLTNQRMYLWIGTKRIKTYVVSTGKPSTPTPTGLFYTQNKISRAYSRMASLWMPWWMGVVGGVGIHELPEWGNGHKEGSWDLGLKVSHGCIRLGVGPAYKTYEWTPIGTPVYIHN